MDEIISNFLFEGEFMGAQAYGCGHINDTLAARFIKSDGQSHRYVLQRINHKVFKCPDLLMQNVMRITCHLRKKIMEMGGNPERETLNFVCAVGGGSFYKTMDGDYWRSYRFIEDAQTYEVVENASHFYHAGRAFGKFQKLLGDFPAETLHETIPDFHNTKKRYVAFNEAVKKDLKNRAVHVQTEIDFVRSREKDASVLVDLLAQGKLPLRVTHNDTKFNNVLIDNKTGEGICVLDLDTAMPGLSLYDFGDSIRSGANPAEEDEQDLNKVWMDMELFENFTRGFLEAAGEFLTPMELKYLAYSAKIMTFECGIRFLTDYLNGDTYFKIHREGHNLDRARTQFKMVADMEGKLEEMNRIVDKYSGK